MTFSTFKSVRETAPTSTSTLENFISKIRDPKNWKSKVDEIQAQPDKKSRDQLKESSLPCASLSCIVGEARRTEFIQSHTGLMQCDFDGADNPGLDQEKMRELLKNDEHIQAVFIGPSGTGIKAVARIDGSRHGESYDSAKEYFLKHYGLVLDPMCRDVVRPCFASFDPNAWYRPEEASTLPIVITAEESIQRSLPRQNRQTILPPYTEQDVAEMLSFIDYRPDGATWVKIISGVANHLGDDVAHRLLIEWRPEEKRNEYRKRMRVRKSTVGIGTVAALAEDNGWVPGEHTRFKKSLPQRPVQAKKEESQVESHPDPKLPPPSPFASITNQINALKNETALPDWIHELPEAEFLTELKKDDYNGLRDLYKARRKDVHREQKRAKKEAEKIEQEKNRRSLEAKREGAEKMLPTLPAYYNMSDGGYVFGDEGVWLTIGRPDMMIRLTNRGFATEKDERGSMADRALEYIQKTNYIHSHGPLAGHETGLKTFGNIRFLVTTTSYVLQPKKGPWNTIRKFLEGLAGINNPDEDNAVVQYEYLLSTFSIWAKDRRSPERLEGNPFSQLLVLIGDGDDGKTLLQNHIITPLLGNKANPWDFLSGAAGAINGDLFAAEHMMISDPPVLTKNGRATQEIVTHMVKSMISNPEQSCRAMWSPTETPMPVFWRFSMSMNWSALRAHPILEPATRDRIISLRVYKGGGIPACQSEKRAFLEALKSEVPAFLYHLLHEYEPPKAILASRGGVIGWQHPEILRQLPNQARDSVLDDLIARKYFHGDGPHMKFKITHTRLFGDLGNDPMLGRAFFMAFKEPDMLLKALKDMLEHGRVEYNKDDKRGQWMILPPEKHS